MENNLENIKVGDKVMCIKRCEGIRRYTISEVTRVTKTLFEIKEGRFKKSNGRSVDEFCWWSCCLVDSKLMAEIDEEVKRNSLIKRIKDFVGSSKFFTLTTEQMEQIANILPKEV